MKRLLLLLSISVLTQVGLGQYSVDFEGSGETKSSYASGNVSLSGIQWNLKNALIGTSSSDYKVGSRSLRSRGYGSSEMTMNANKTNGLGTITFSYRRYRRDSQVSHKVEYSTDNGGSWTQAGNNFTGSATVKNFSATINVSGSVRIRIKTVSNSGTRNRRLNIDNIILTDYNSGGGSNHTVTFNANGGTGTMTAQTASSSTPLTSNTFTYAGYTFNGWNTLANGSGTSYADGENYNFNADITLYAQWTAAGGGSTCLSENFTTLSLGSYTDGSFTLNGNTWSGVQVIQESSSNSYGGTGKALRINDDKSGAQLTTPALNAPQNISFYFRELNTGGGTFIIQKSINGGVYTNICTKAYSGTNYTSFTCNINESNNNVKIRILSDRNSGHLIVDNIEVICGTSSGGGCTPPHTITSIAPTGGPIGTDVKITGAGFTAATTATIGGIAATVNYNSATELIVEIPTGATSNEIVLTENTCEANSASFTITTASGTCSGSNSFTDIIISEVYDSDANNVWYVELFNPTNAAIDLAAGGYELNRYGNLTGTGGYRNINLTGTIPAGSVFLLRLGTSGNTCTKTWDFTLTGAGINENDRNELTKNGTVIDVVHLPNQTGYTVKRKGTATGPKATYSSSDWDISLVENCAHLGTAPISTFTNPTITSIADQTACELNFSVSATAGNAGALTYQWYYNDGTATTWTAVSNTSPTGLTVLGATDNNLLIGSGANDISTISGYQFYCEVIEATTCKNVSNAATFKIAIEPYFRTKQSGVWKDKANWEMATSATGTWSAACTYPTAENSDHISIKDSIYITENPAIDPDISADQLIIETTGKLVLGNNAELHIENGATGSDFEIKGTYIDASSSGSGNGITFNNGATWSIVANATIMKTNTSSATRYRDNYETGIANIPATANWVYRYDGTGNVSIANSTSGKPMYYPNLTFESTNGVHSFNTLSQVFIGRYEKVTVKGDLTIGSNAANAVTVYNNNFNTEPMLIAGDLYIAAGSKLTNQVYRTPNAIGTYNSSWREGAGFELKGGAIIEGVFDATHKTNVATNPTHAIAPGNEGVIFSGTAKQDILGGTAESFITNNVTINNASHIELTDINLEIEGKLKFTTGKVITTTTKPDMVWVKNNATTAITGGNTSGTSNYVEGKLQWNLTNGNTYPFPIGDSAQNAQGFELTANNGTGNVLAYLEINNTNPIQTKAYCDLEQYPVNGTGTVNAGNGTAGYDGILDQITFNVKSPLQWNITNPGGGITNYNVKILANGGQDISPVTTANNIAVRYLLKNGQAYNGATVASTTNGTSNGFNAVGFEACPNQYTLNGMTSFSKFTLNGAAQTSTVLPIELLSFSATLNQSKVVDLEWITATEINNDYFTLERSKNGEGFETIGSVKGAGNSNEKLTYSYVDAKPYQGISYYRLKQTDFDGQFSYSKIKVIENNTLGENMDISIYPNPTEDILYVKINATSLEKDNASYFIYDNLGKLVQQNILQNNESKINTALLQKGVYQLKIVNQNIDKSLVFIKK